MAKQEKDRAPTRREIEDTRTEGGAEALAMMARKLGYREKWGQLQFNNGATASDLFAFFDDNPGAVAAVVQWVLDEGCTSEGEQLLDEEEKRKRRVNIAHEPVTIS